MSRTMKRVTTLALLVAVTVSPGCVYYKQTWKDLNSREFWRGVSDATIEGVMRDREIDLAVRNARRSAALDAAIFDSHHRRKDY